MATLWQKAHLFDPSRASVATWVFTIARNRRIDALRKARRPEPEDLPWGPEPEPDQAEVLEMQQESRRLGAGSGAAAGKAARTDRARLFRRSLAFRDRRRNRSAAGHDQIPYPTGAGPLRHQMS